MRRFGTGNFWRRLSEPALRERSRSGAGARAGPSALYPWWCDAKRRWPAPCEGGRPFTSFLVSVAAGVVLCTGRPFYTKEFTRLSQFPSGAPSTSQAPRGLPEPRGQSTGRARSRPHRRGGTPPAPGCAPLAQPGLGKRSRFQGDVLACTAPGADLGPLPWSMVTRRPIWAPGWISTRSCAARCARGAAQGAEGAGSTTSDLPYGPIGRASQDDKEAPPRDAGQPGPAPASLGCPRGSA